MPDHHWGKLAERFRRHFPKQDVPLFKAILNASVLSNCLGTRGHVSEVSDSICYDHPIETWPPVAEALLADTGYIFRMWLADMGYYGRPMRQPFLAFRRGDIFAWIDTDPQPRALVIAELVPQTLEAGAVGDMTRAFIERYSDLPHISQAMFMRFHAGSWTGSTSGHLDGKRTLARKWLGETTSLKLQDWLDGHIDDL